MIRVSLGLNTVPECLISDDCAMWDMHNGNVQEAVLCGFYCTLKAPILQGMMLFGPY